MILGSDHSRYDWMTGDGDYSPINWAASKSVYAFLKACDGVTPVQRYPDELAAARAAGKLTAPYLWLHGRNWYDPRRQAEAWYPIVKDEPLIAIDFEGYLDSLPTYDDLFNAIERLKALGFSGKIIIYTGHYYWTAYGSTASYWQQFPVWLARYSTEEPQVTPPWTGWTFWQFSASGNPSDYGITNGKKAVDENRFNGTMEELVNLFGGTITPPPPQEENMELYTVTTNALNVRSSPEILTNNIIGQMVRGNTFRVVEKRGDWARFDAADNFGTAVTALGWCSIKAGFSIKSSLAIPTGGETYPVVKFSITDAGGKYPPLEATWTPL